MPRVVVDRVRGLLAERGCNLRGAHVLLLGVTYKRDVGELRNSLALDVLELLRAEGAHISYADPYVPSLCTGDGRMLHACAPTPATLAAQHLVIVTTDHGAFDWDTVAEHARCVFDTRGCRHEDANLIENAPYALAGPTPVAGFILATH